MAVLPLNFSAPEERITLFADVILPVPIPNLFTYRIPYELNDLVKVGCRVVVQFGARKILTGLIGKLHQQVPDKYEAKYILDLLDEHPVITLQQLPLFHWIAEYYMCTIGEVYNCALPSGLKLSSESRIQLNPTFDPEENDVELSEQENIIVENLKNNQTLSYGEVGKLLELTNYNAVIKSLIRKNIIALFEEVKEKFKPKIEKRIRLREHYVFNKSNLETLFKELEKNPSQVDLILKFLQLVPVYQKPHLNKTGVAKSIFKEAGLSVSSLNTLIKNNIFEEYALTISRFDTVDTLETIPELSSDQEQTYNEILDHFQAKDTVLLHGITGSGKTNIYLKLIQNVLENGNQVLYLLPEIALTTQIVNRLKQFFGERMGIYHSRFSSSERVEVWNGVLSGKFDLIIGVRSSVFLPFSDLGLIIVDEEHESSFKQYDPAPRYHARDLALVLAQHHHAKTLLGSATPSIESYFHALHDKYGLVQLHKRFGIAQLPQFILADIRLEKKKHLMHGDFTSELLQHLEENLQKNEQSIIFQNRRGYSPYLTCEECAWIPKCKNCSVSLTYHQYLHEVRCHYCGHREKVPSSCPACGTSKIKSVGFGTEKLEEDLKVLLPSARIQRMDLDTTRKKYSYQSIIDDFEKGNVDILVGTQMVSKGLDFDKVSLVGVFDVDRLIHFPDFRSYEKAFQLITQVSGRAGRREKTGLVVIQTANTQQEVLHKIITGDYQSFFEREIWERERFNYPPFSRMIRITIKNENKEVADQLARKLKDQLEAMLVHQQVLGPQEPLIGRIRNQYLVDILVKIPRNKGNLNQIKKKIQEAADHLKQDNFFKNTRIIFDVDPY
ncbi:primosomal protein N' [soil metagenome]